MWNTKYPQTESSGLPFFTGVVLIIFQRLENETGLGVIFRLGRSLIDCLESNFS